MAKGTYFKDSGKINTPVVVCIHGLGLNMEMWQWLLPALKRHNRVIVYDLWGHGKSDDLPSEPSLSLFREQFKFLVEHIAIQKITLIGFSLGGMIARRIAQDMPELIHRLVVLSSAHKRTPEAQSAILSRVEQAREEGASATVEAALKRWFTDDFRSKSPATIDLVRSWILANKKSEYYRVYRVLAEANLEIIEQDKPISCPTLVITGDEDFGNGPEMAKKIAAEIKQSEVIILKGLRHMALVENPQAVIMPIIKFLAQH